jgi:hypothetical protein
MVGFVDDQQVVLDVTPGSEPTELLEAHKIRSYLCAAKNVSPHLRQRSWRDNEPARIPARHSGGDKSLAHPDLVAEQSAAEFVDRRVDSVYGRQLVRTKRDPANPHVGLIVTQNEARDSRADLIPRRQSESVVQESRG